MRTPRETRTTRWNSATRMTWMSTRRVRMTISEMTTLTAISIWMLPHLRLLLPSQNPCQDPGSKTPPRHAPRPNPLLRKQRRLGPRTTRKRVMSSASSRVSRRRWTRPSRLPVNSATKTPKGRKTISTPRARRLKL